MPWSLYKHRNPRIVQVIQDSSDSYSQTRRKLSWLLIWSLSYLLITSQNNLDMILINNIFCHVKSNDLELPAGQWVFSYLFQKCSSFQQRIIFSPLDVSNRSIPIFPYPQPSKWHWNLWWYKYHEWSLLTPAITATNIALDPKSNGKYHIYEINQIQKSKNKHWWNWSVHHLQSMMFWNCFHYDSLCIISSIPCFWTKFILFKCIWCFLQQ